MAKATASREGGGYLGTTTLAISVDPEDIEKLQAGESVDVAIDWALVSDAAGNKPGREGVPDVITLSVPN